MQLQVATLVLCLRGATGLHARPATLLSPRRVCRVRNVAPVCAEDGDDSDELAKARRRRDEQALQSEWRDGLSNNAQVSLGPSPSLCLASASPPPPPRLSLRASASASAAAPHVDSRLT